MTAALATAPFAEVTIGADKVSLLKDGQQAFPSMLAAIASAKETICFETYILRDDRTGRLFAQALGERARAGVEVNLMFDQWGSSVSDDFVDLLRADRVRLVIFQPVRFSRGLGAVVARLKRRNHRKALTIDGKVGFTGGLNISDEYAAEEDGGKAWRDTAVRIEGPVVEELERLFLGTWRANRGAPLDEKRYQRERPAPGGKVRILGNHFRKDRKDIRKAYVNAMHAAQRSIHLTHAYFIPPGRIIRELERAARRNVKVVVILAAATDQSIVLWAARGLYARMLRAGIQVYEWEGRILHAKTAVVDGRWSTVGSANLDALSLRQNLEVNAVFEAAAFAAAVERMFEADLPSCQLITKEDVKNRPLLDRVLSWFALHLRKWL